MQIRQIEEQLESVISAAKSINMSLEEIKERVVLIYEEI